MGRNEPTQIKFKYLTEPGKRVAKIDSKKKLIITLISVLFFFVFIVGSRSNFFRDFSNFLTTDFKIVLIFSSIFFLIFLLSILSSTRLVLLMSTNTVIMERKFLNWRYSYKEFGNSKNIQLKLVPHNIFLFKNKETENFFMIMNDTSRQTTTPLFQGQYVINKSEAEKLASYLNIKIETLQKENESSNNAIVEGNDNNYSHLKINDISGYAVASIILGGVALFMLFMGGIIGIVALIFGIMALKDIKKNNKKGKTIAIIGIIAGVISIAISGAFMALLIAGLNSPEANFNIDILGNTNKCEDQPGYVCTELECNDYAYLMFNQTGEYKNYVPRFAMNCPSNQICCAPLD